MGRANERKQLDFDFMLKASVSSGASFFAYI
jgi:hypothetical protein